MTKTAAASGSQADGRSVLGAFLVAGSALVWSFGGAIARTLSVTDPWAIIFWRSLFAALFLLCFMLVRDGPRGTVALFRGMGWPGLAVAACFAVASGTFILALQHTSVANILLIQAAVPLIAALMGVVLFGERVGLATWAAIAGVIAGVGIMVSASFGGKVSPIGDGLALLIATSFATATVITRRYSHVRMTPAVCAGTLMILAAATPLVTAFPVSMPDMGLLFAFGALNLGLGLALFTTGARLLAAPLAAMIGTLETVLGPIWAWAIHGETAGPRTLIGGAVVLTALLLHIAAQAWNEQRRTR
jgi:drug/metabolite transporter (DMT)-like permease